MKKTHQIIALVLMLLIIAGISYYFYYLSVKNNNKTIDLQGIEIQNYEGQNLSSVNDFRENSIKGPQYIDKESYKLKIMGLSGGEKDLSYDELVNNYQNYKKVVILNCVEGWRVTILWEGILVKDLLKDDIPSEANTVIFRAVDGYSTSFPLDYILNNDIIMAYKMNDIELPPERGFPFQLVAEEKWGYKWIKWITEIELSSDSSYEGYWESRGYPNSGDL